MSPNDATQPPRKRDGLRILRTLSHAGFDARFAGGCVRDQLLGKEASDYDIATTAHPDEVCALFKQKNVKVVPTGISHGTVTVVLPSGPFEVTTLRHDVETDGRRATVRFGTSFEEDAARRDFTVNAMFQDADGHVSDFFGGRADVAARRLRFVGQAATRLREDYLRMLRFFRFLAQLNFAPDPEAVAAIRDAAPHVRRVSQERITAEFLKTLATPAPEASLALMAETGLLAQLFPPEVPVRWDEAAATASRAVAVLDPALRALARLALFYREAPAAVRDGAGEAWRLSHADARSLRLLAEGPGDAPAADASRATLMEQLDRWEKEWGERHALSALLKAWGLLYPEKDAALQVMARCEEKHGALRRRNLPLDGQTLMRELGWAPSPALGEALAALKRAYRDEAWHSREEGLAWARRWAAAVAPPKDAP